MWELLFRYRNLLIPFIFLFFTSCSGRLTPKIEATTPLISESPTFTITPSPTSTQTTTPTPTFKPSPTPKPIGYVIGSTVPLVTCPEKDCDNLLYLSKGKSFIVIGKNISADDVWLEVKYEDEIGWIHLDDKVELPEGLFENLDQISWIPTPTLVPQEDYDNDGLINREEILKYKTNPYKADSDSDGIIDYDLDERREFVYSVYALVKIRQPFDVEAMNDMYQDVEIVSEVDDRGYSTIKIIIYPYTDIPLIPSTFPLRNLPEELLEYTKPGISTNYSPDMQVAVKEIVRFYDSDYEVVGKIISWIDSETQLADFPFQPEVFYFAYTKDGEVYLRNPPSLSTTRMLDELLFANSMFEKRVHGTCCSTATLKCAMIKAAGVPCKIIQTLPLVFSHESQKEEYKNNMDKAWNDFFENQPVNKPVWLASHCFLEVYLGDQWVRVDRGINVYSDYPDDLILKIYSVSDLTDIDISLIYPVNWIYNRPFYTLLLEDQEPIH